METKGKEFRRLLNEEHYLFTAEVYSPLDAQIAERAGFKTIYMSGGSVSMLNGWPAMGFLARREMTRNASIMASAVNIPVIADALDGYGHALNTIRTVQEYIKTGIAGIHLEDQQYPKRFGHMDGKSILNRGEALGKFRAAVAERDSLDPNFLLIARTDAFGAVGGSLEEAIWRGRAYADLGVDLVWCEFSSSDRRPIFTFAEAMRKTHPRLPLAFNYSSSNWSTDPKPLKFRELGELGYKFIFIARFAAHASMSAVWDAIEDLAENEEQAQWSLEKVKAGHLTESHHEMPRLLNSKS